MAANKSRELPRALWLWCMPLPLLVHLIARQIDRDSRFFDRFIESELGIVENGTALLLIPACIFALALARRYWRRVQPVVATWFFLYALMCFGFAGEEVSWGQHWLGWQSPEYFIEHNRQGETNFHNLNIHFGRVVKSILTLAIIIGGLILPLRRRNKSPTTGFWAAVTPGLSVVPAALFVFGVRLIERFKTWFDLEWAWLAVNLKESQELYIAIFLLLYAWSLWLTTAND